jgi:hypothetical protein
MPTSIVTLQRRHANPRADELLEELQRDRDVRDRVRWNESGHARLNSTQPLDEARLTIAKRLDALDRGWREHISIL